MANEKISPEMAARIEQFRREFEAQYSNPGLNSILRMNSAIGQRQLAYARYEKYILAPIPSDYPVAIKGRLITREKGNTDPAPFVTVICDMTQAFKRNDIRRAHQNLLDNVDNLDHVTLTDDEWEDLVNREVKNRNHLPLPYYHEALQDFTICMEDGTIIPFCRSSLPRIKYNDYDIIPMVDTLINCEYKKTLLFGLGLINVEEDIYQVAIYWFGNVDPDYHGNIVGILHDYFYAQWAFHTCPERIIEVKPGDPNPFEGEDEPAKPSKPHKNYDRKPSSASIARKIYIRDFPSDGKRTIERRCRCWYVHGFMRTYRKTGKQVWIEGYFKGPDRDNPAARQHTKNYVMD